MPIGVVVEEKERFDLKSLPGAYVIVRRMNYGESLQRKDLMASIAMSMDRTGKTADANLELKMLQEKTALWEFGNLILEHNITDARENPLNFKNADHVKMLVGRIGDEIQECINKINSFEENEEVKN